ncbi:Zn-ribbon domain-containing OB-fold protein [Pseudonocardia xishanensis]|uniref:ChsH2 C-terminal OB-fold domain-containing protein n=1 Tax=Pseudonocardia xishanensis TaxID=630995 RepID=A0ABP8RGN4_9PSEU
MTLAVAAGRRGISAAGDPEIERVVLVSRDLPLLEGGNSAALLAGLGLRRSVQAVEQVGGAAAVLDAMLAAPAATLVIGADVGERAGAAAAVTGTGGLGLRYVGRINRSLPVLARDAAGGLHDYEDPRLLRERGAVASLEALGRPKLDAIAGLGHREARDLCTGAPPEIPTVGASSVLFALAATTPRPGALLAAVDQASVTVVELDGGAAVVERDERAAQPSPSTTLTEGPPIPLSLSAYDRAFEAKLGWRASTDADTGELQFPPRAHDAVRGDEGDVILVELPRRGAVYTSSTIAVPVPGKRTPYQLVIVELDGVGIRALAATTGTAGSVAIGAQGEMVFRRIEVRSGIPDYGYAFRPDLEVTA